MSSNLQCGTTLSLPVTVLQYPDMSGWVQDDGALRPEAATQDLNGAQKRGPEMVLSGAELVATIERERADAAREAEKRLRTEYEQKLVAARAPIADAISAFEERRNDYYARVEAEVVQLALAIAAKILHREAQVDPMLVAALVRMAMEKMNEGSRVTVRVSAGRGESWRRYFSEFPSMAQVEVAEDMQLCDQDCLVETELGTANFGLDAQLKEVEQGFFDLLALRPTAK